MTPTTVTLLDAKKGTVVVTVDYTVVAQQADPVNHIVTAAVSELALVKGYQGEETNFLKEDAVLNESAKVVYRKMRDRHNSFPNAEYKAKRKGEEYVQPPNIHKVSLHYTRPGTRGRLDREV